MCARIKSFVVLVVHVNASWLRLSGSDIARFKDFVLLHVGVPSHVYSWNGLYVWDAYGAKVFD